MRGREPPVAVHRPRIAVFAPPTSGQAIPNPLPITAAIYGPNGIQAVFAPAR